MAETLDPHTVEKDIRRREGLAVFRKNGLTRFLFDSRRRLKRRDRYQRNTADLNGVDGTFSDEQVQLRPPDAGQTGFVGFASTCDGVDRVLDGVDKHLLEADARRKEQNRGPVWQHHLHADIVLNEQRPHEGQGGADHVAQIERFGAVILDPDVARNARDDIAYP